MINYQLITQVIEKFSKSPERKQFIKDSLETAQKATDKLLETLRYDLNDN